LSRQCTISACVFTAVVLASFTPGVASPNRFIQIIAPPGTDSCFLHVPIFPFTAGTADPTTGVPTPTSSSSASSFGDWSFLTSGALDSTMFGSDGSFSAAAIASALDGSQASSSSVSSSATTAASGQSAGQIGAVGATGGTYSRMLPFATLVGAQISSVGAFSLSRCELILPVMRLTAQQLIFSRSLKCPFSCTTIATTSTPSP